MTEASELINRSNTICHYTRFPGFSDPNCNGCNGHDPKMVELLHLFAENGLEGDGLLHGFFVMGDQARLFLAS